MTSPGHFTYEQIELDAAIKVWTENKWPVDVVKNDHYSAKLLQDNKIFESIRSNNHQWKYDEQAGFLVWGPKSEEGPSEYMAWNELLQWFNVEKKGGELKITNATYTSRGLEIKRTFQFTEAEMKDQEKRWISEKWPIEFLLRDHFGAKVLFDCQVFQLIHFYGHQWKWNAETGLSILFKRTEKDKAEYTPWEKIAKIVPVCRTPQGWLLFDGWNYLQDGLVPVHLWEFPKVVPSYTFAANKRPSYSYVDFITFNWEHEGMPGFGMAMGPHGHLCVEFGDDDGNFYSVGMYMDPRSPINTKVFPFATIKACLMSPDPYMASSGEKVLHRYNLGEGEEGRKKLKRFIQYIEDVQAYKKNPDTGMVSCCQRKYHAFGANCGDFVIELERFTVEVLKGQLFKPTRDFAPGRELTKPKEAESTFSQIYHVITNMLLLALVDILIWIFAFTPVIKDKLGSGLHDRFVKPYLSEPLWSVDKAKVITNGEEKGLFGPFFYVWRILGTMFRATRFPRRQRLEQLNSARLSPYSVLLKS